MASPIETIKAGLGKVKAVNKAKKDIAITGENPKAKGYFADAPDAQDGIASRRNKFNNTPTNQPNGIVGENRIGNVRQGDISINRKEAAASKTPIQERPINRLTGPRGKLPSVIGGAASVLDTASEIDNIRKGKSDILQRTGIYKQPKEL